MAREIEERTAGAVTCLRGLIADMLVIQVSPYRGNVVEEDMVAFEDHLCELLRLATELRIPLTENPPSPIVRKLTRPSVNSLAWRGRARQEERDRARLRAAEAAEAKKG
jgi:hypothetical protein